MARPLPVNVRSSPETGQGPAQQHPQGSSPAAQPAAWPPTCVSMVTVHKLPPGPPNRPKPAAAELNRPGVGVGAGGLPAGPSAPVTSAEDGSSGGGSAHPRASPKQPQLPRAPATQERAERGGPHPRGAARGREWPRVAAGPLGLRRATHAGVGHVGRSARQRPGCERPRRAGASRCLARPGGGYL